MIWLNFIITIIKKISISPEICFGQVEQSKNELSSLKSHEWELANQLTEISKDNYNYESKTFAFTNNEYIYDGPIVIFVLLLINSNILSIEIQWNDIFKTKRPSVIYVWGDA